MDAMNGPHETIEDSVIVDFNLAYQHKYKSLQLKHVFSVQNLFDTQVTFPAYVYRDLNEIPLESDRGISYSFIAQF